MAKTLKDLVLALLNATLILVAVCLFLAWKVSGTAERVVASFSQNLEVLKPMREEVQGVQQEIAGLRSDLADLRGSASAVPAAALNRLDQRVDTLNTKLETMQGNMAQLAEAPDRLMTAAVDRTIDGLAETAKDLRGCTAPDGS